MGVTGGEAGDVSSSTEQTGHLHVEDGRVERGWSNRRADVVAAFGGRKTFCRHIVYAQISSPAMT